MPSPRGERALSQRVHPRWFADGPPTQSATASNPRSHLAQEPQEDRYLISPPSPTTKWTRLASG